MCQLCSKLVREKTKQISCSNVGELIKRKNKGCETLRDKLEGVRVLTIKYRYGKEEEKEGEEEVMGQVE